MTDEEIRYLFDKGFLKKGLVPYKKLGGQSCGMMPRKVFIKCEELGIRIEIECERSQLKNYELALEMLFVKLNTFTFIDLIEVFHIK